MYLQYTSKLSCILKQYTSRPTYTHLGLLIHIQAYRHQRYIILRPHSNIFQAINDIRNPSFIQSPFDFVSKQHQGQGYRIVKHSKIRIVKHSKIRIVKHLKVSQNPNPPLTIFQNQVFNDPFLVSKIFFNENSGCF